jgi:hypothetical protein
MFHEGNFDARVLFTLEQNPSRPFTVGRVVGHALDREILEDLIALGGHLASTLAIAECDQLLGFIRATEGSGA